jgi:aminoglycoside phosphotransferase family enzyme/predicted kinase
LPDYASQNRVVDYLSRSRTYGQSEPVGIHTTHGSVVFVARENAYKLKRAVKLPYMDYSTSALRKQMCERELVVNRRTAPALYLGVKALIPEGDSFRFGNPNDVEAIDYVVVMQRFSEHSLLASLARAGTLGLETMRPLAEAVAALHQSADEAPEFGGANGMHNVIEENVGIFRKNSLHFSAETIARYAHLSTQRLDALRASLMMRREAGRVRRCHGDLHLNNVCIIDGKPILFDAIEFNDEFSCVDVGYDLAYLLMDLETYGLRKHANLLLNRYLECTQDYSLLSVLPLFLSARAAIKSHILVAQKRTDDVMPEGQRPGDFLDRAIAYLAPPQVNLVAVGGLSGSGKTTVAREIAFEIGAAPGAVILRTDIIRKAMFNASEDSKLPASCYEPAVNQAVYDRLYEIASRILEAGHSVVSDAVFGSEGERQSAEALAARHGAAFHAFWLFVATKEAERRLAQRTNDASDADVQVLHRQMEAIVAPHNWSSVDAGRPLEQVVQAVHKALDTRELDRSQ